MSAFLQLLKKAGFTHQDELYVLGDVIDRNGDGGIELLRWMMRQDNVFLILGNHEYLMLLCDFLFEEITDSNLGNLDADCLSLLSDWIGNGGSPTLNSLRRLNHTQPEELRSLLEYLRDAPLYDILKVNGKVFILTHAGLGNFSPEKDLPDYTEEELLWHRPAITEAYYPNTVTVFGHTPTLLYGEEYKGKMLRTETWIAIDTGVAAGLDPMLLRLEDEQPFYR